MKEKKEGTQSAGAAEGGRRPSGAAPAGRERGRFSSGRKAEGVLQLLRGVCVELSIPRSTVYAQRAVDEFLPRRKPGPKPLVPDGELLAAIREVHTDPPFMSEGHRKVHARLRYRCIHADIERVRLLMRDHGLQAPGKPRRVLGPRAHDGTITTQKPDEMWGTDATSTMLLNGQQATIFGVYDHCTCELMGIHAAIEADRYEAMVPLHQACRMAFGSVEQDSQAA